MRTNYKNIMKMMDEIETLLYDFLEKTYARNHNFRAKPRNYGLLKKFTTNHQFGKCSHYTLRTLRAMSDFSFFCVRFHY